MEELADLDRYGIRPILAALETTGQLQNTVIFFTSDNGYLHGEHRQRAKDLPYWESSEVPFFVKGPGVKSSATRTAFVNHTDLMPTTCEIAGIRPAALDVDGRSMLANLRRRAFLRIGVEPVPHQARKTVPQGSMSVFRATEDPSSGLLQLLFIQSRKVNSQKFACTAYSEVGGTESSQRIRSAPLLAWMKGA
jgi:hypothetical protein